MEPNEIDLYKHYEYLISTKFEYIMLCNEISDQYFFDNSLTKIEACCINSTMIYFHIKLAEKFCDYIKTWHKQDNLRKGFFSVGSSDFAIGFFRDKYNSPCVLIAVEQIGNEDKLKLNLKYGFKINYDTIPILTKNILRVARSVNLTETNADNPQ